MAMRYRHLRETAREAVGVFRSSIHGRGLFCKRDIDAGEMVIEYAGQVSCTNLLLFIGCMQLIVLGIQVNFCLE